MESYDNKNTALIIAMLGSFLTPFMASSVNVAAGAGIEPMYIAKRIFSFSGYIRIFRTFSGFLLRKLLWF